MGRWLCPAVRRSPAPPYTLASPANRFEWYPASVDAPPRKAESKKGNEPQTRRAPARRPSVGAPGSDADSKTSAITSLAPYVVETFQRSEERRVGKEYE